LKEASLGLVFPPALEQIVSKMLAKSPAARYDDLGKAALELNAVVRGEPLPSTSNKPATASKATTWIQLHKSKVQLVVFVATVALVSFIIGLAVNKPTTSQSREAVAPTEQKAEIASVLPEDNLEDSYEIDLLSHPTKDARLKYEMVPVGKKLMEKISETKWIHQLILNNCQIDNQSVHYLASLDLEHLELDGSALDEVGAAGLTNCHALKNIELKNVTVTAAVLKSLSKLKNIEVLNLTGATLEGDCLLPISRMVNLRRLDLTGVRSIKAGSLKYFERLNHLHEFDLNRTNVAKQGLLSFCRQNKSCKVIFLHDCPLVKKADTQTLRDEFRTVQFLTE
jgi:hypothetical protein